MRRRSAAERCSDGRTADARANIDVPANDGMQVGSTAR
jgi:hypothetical protein